MGYISIIEIRMVEILKLSSILTAPVQIKQFDLLHLNGSFFIKFNFDDTFQILPIVISLVKIFTIHNSVISDFVFLKIYEIIMTCNLKVR